jgi:hypothetical protein
MTRRLIDREQPAPPWHALAAPEPGETAASVTIWRNPLDPADRVTVPVAAGVTLIGWLQLHHPHGFGRPIAILWNGQDVDIEDSDRAIAPGDVIGIYVPPGLPATATPFAVAFVHALIAAAISIIATLAVSIIFKPKKPGTTPTPDPVYSLSGAANSARLGDPIPAIYGQVITVPDWASQPYTFFAGNNQYLDQILVIGQGQYRIDQIILADTPVSGLLDPTAVQSWIYPSSAHLQTMGTIEAATTVMENVVTSAEVSDQELNGDQTGNTSVTLQTASSTTAPSTVTIAYQYNNNNLPPASLPAGPFTLADYDHVNPNDGKTFSVKTYVPATGVITTNETSVLTGALKTEIYLYFPGSNPGVAAGPFVACKPGARGNRVMLDFVWPSGLFSLATNGSLQPRTVQFNVTLQPIDDNGISNGTAIVHNESVTQASNTPVRMTFTYDVPVGRYSVRVVRTTGPAPNTQTVDSFTWTELKFRLLPAATPVYGDVTLLVIRTRATNGIADAAATRVRVQCTRLVAPLGQGTPVPSRDPADAFADVYCNLVYGARRPVGELDIATLAALQAHWAGRARFDAIFNTKSTIWDALGLTLQPAGAAALPVGQKMSAVQDGVKALRTQFYSDANMAPGSLQISYSFDTPGEYDGYSVEYRDPTTFAAVNAYYPPGTADPEQVTLFGCTDATTAAQYAQLLWQRRLRQRKSAQFTTELEGLIPRFGDRVAVAARLPSWGQTGVIVAVTGLAVRTDQPLDWSAASPVMVLRSEVGEPSGLIMVTRGATDDEAILATGPGFAMHPGYAQESTYYSFGSSTSVVRDFVVTNLAHQGGVATDVGAMVYDPAIYTGTMPWMSEPI